jgi:hypothetical protein
VTVVQIDPVGGPPRRSADKTPDPHFISSRELYPDHTQSARNADAEQGARSKIAIWIWTAISHKLYSTRHTVPNQQASGSDAIPSDVRPDDRRQSDRGPRSRGPPKKKTDLDVVGWFVGGQKSTSGDGQKCLGWRYSMGFQTPRTMPMPLTKPPSKLLLRQLPVVVAK